MNELHLTAFELWVAGSSLGFNACLLIVCLFDMFYDRGE